MRARLLDMGEVGAVRCQSLPHAVAVTMRPDADPAVVLACPSSACVSIGDEREAAAEVDLGFCRERRLPVIRRRGSGGALLVDENQLLWSVVLPAARAAEPGLPERPEERLEALGRVSVAAHRRLGIDDVSFRPPSDVRVGGRTIAWVDVAEIGGGLNLTGNMVFDYDSELLAQALRRPADGMTSIRRELAEPPGAETIAEALIAALESCFGLELIPSMPAPEEMDAIYEWDERLAADPASDRPQRLIA